MKQRGHVSAVCVSMLLVLVLAGSGWAGIYTDWFDSRLLPLYEYDRFSPTSGTWGYAPASQNILGITFGLTIVPDDPYLPVTDYQASWTQGGDITFSFDRPGQYFFKVSYADATPDYIGLALWQAIEDGKTGADKKTSGGDHNPYPDADLYIRGNAPGDGNAATRKGIYESISANKTVPVSGENGVRDAADAINAAHKGDPLTIVISDHGNSGDQSVGAGEDNVPGSQLNDRSQATKDFKDAVRGKVKKIWLLGCHVGKDQDFLEYLSCCGADINAFTSTVTHVEGVKNPDGSWKHKPYFIASGHVHQSACPEPCGVLVLLVGIGAIGSVARRAKRLS